MSHALVYLEQEQRDQLEVIANTPEEIEALPECVQILIRLYFMWEE